MPPVGPKIISYKATLPSGRKITLINTRGYDDTNSTNSKILQELRLFFSKTEDVNKTLSGLIYLHRITDIQVPSTTRLLSLFKVLLGRDLSNLVLATTCWQLCDEEFGVRKEKEIKERSWRLLMAQGARMFRLYPTRDSALDLVGQFDIAFSSEIEDRSHPKAGRSSKSESEPSIYERLDPGQIRLVDLLSGESKEPVAV